MLTAMHDVAFEGELDRGRLRDVWDVWKRPKTKLERPRSAWFADADETEARGRAVGMPRDAWDV